MAGRFLVQKLASGISRSRASLGAHGPSARAAAPAAGTPPVAGTVPVSTEISIVSIIATPVALENFGGVLVSIGSSYSHYGSGLPNNSLVFWFTIFILAEISPFSLKIDEISDF